MGFETFDPFFVALTKDFVVREGEGGVVIRCFYLISHLGQPSVKVHGLERTFLPDLVLGILGDLEQLFALPMEWFAVKKHIHRLAYVVQTDDGYIALCSHGLEEILH